MENNVSRVLIISGMHRSGTSLVANYLRKCGLYIGNTLVKPDRGNPLGYYEDREILEIHESELNKKGIDAFNIDERLLPLNISDGNRLKAEKVVAQRSGVLQWGWKEPRTTLFLTFWDSLIPEAKYLFLFRHPLAVLDSLLRRGTDRNIVKKPIVGRPNMRPSGWTRRRANPDF